MKKNYIFLLVVSLISATLASQTPYDSFAPESTRPMLDNSFSSAEVTAIEQAFKQSDAVDFQWGSFSLLADSGTLVHDLPFSFALIPNGGEHRMPSYMVNVTGENVGAYRLLPNGVHFSEPATIAVPYDDFLLPMGYNPKDIKTYYFDEDLAQWKELERVSVDTAKHVVISYTTHFTEFANAVIKLPEVPEMKAFVPTAMQDLPDVNPLQGIPMIAPPTANNRGTAELTYPIELPAGRNGMQPNIDLHYSSAGGNDILGVGWSIAQPAITIDTRWGAPRFEPLIETEAYLLNGEQIVLHDENDAPIPLPHQAGTRGFERRLFGVVQYFARNTKNQDRILRRGDSMDSLFWEVTDRYGTTSYYGYDPITNRLNDTAIVKSTHGAVAYWALTATIDMFGNYVHYRYFKENNEVYLSRIDYTGNIRTGALPAYTVYLFYSSNRPDAIANGRLGVLQKKQRLLSCLSVTFNNTAITHYSFDYSYGWHTLYKKRLNYITKDDNPTSFECGCLAENQPHNEWVELASYLEDNHVEDANTIVKMLDDGFGEVTPGSRTTFEYQDAHSLGSVYTQAQSSQIDIPKSYNRSVNRSWSLGGTATVGFGFNAAMTTLSLGANYSYSRGTGIIESMLMDMNGDGLPDIVYQDDTLIYYCRQKINGTFDSARRIYGINALSREVSNTHSFGVQADFGANFSYNPSISDTYTDIYFTDVNGDGLPDQVTPEGVKINSLDNSNHPSFLPLETSTSIEVGNSRCGSVERSNEVDPRLECKNYWVRDSAVLRRSILDADDSHSDTPLNMPNQGQRPDFPLSTNLANTAARPDYFYGQLVGHVPISPSEYSDDSINPGTPQYTNYGSTYNLDLPASWFSSDCKVVSVGDSLFRYHLETVCPESSDLPNVDIVRVWVAPHEGTIRITSDIHLKRDSSDSRLMSRKADGVKYYIQQNQLQRNPEYYIDILAQGTIPANCTDTIHSVINSVSVQANDVFFFRLSANKNRRFDDTEWTQTIQYTSGGTDVYNSANDYVCTGNKDFTAPCEGSVVAGYTLENNQSATFTVKIKQNGSDLMTSNQQISIPWVNVGDVISFEVEYDINNSAEPKWSDIHIHPYVIFSNSSQDGSCSEITGSLTYYPDVHIPATSIIANESDNFRQLFGLLHKGWGQFAYKNTSNATIIDLMMLTNAESGAATSITQTGQSTLEGQVAGISSSSIQNGVENGAIDNSALSMISTINNYSPIENNSNWIAMHPDSRTETWLAYGNLGAIGKKLHSTSIQLDTTLVRQDSLATDMEYDSAIPNAITPNTPVTTVRKKSSSVQHSFSVGSPVPPSVNMSFGTFDIGMDYMDMNGDGFPDFVSSTAIQYSTPWGGLDSIVTPIDIEIGHNNKMTSFGVGFSGSTEDAKRIPGNKMRNTNMYNTSLNGGISPSVSDNIGCATYMDINADGLPDLVKGDSVWYNLGYSFSNGEHIPGLIVNQGQSNCVSGSIGFSLSQYSISGGVGGSVSSNTTTERLIDINGDGHLDKLSANGGTWSVWPMINGYSCATQQSLSLAQTISSVTKNIGTNLGVTAGVPIWGVKFCFGLQTTPWSSSTTQGRGEFMDLNGDGFVDYILEPDNPTGDATIATIYYNRNGTNCVNLLTAVNNPTGNRIELSYQQTEPSVEQRGRTWRLWQVKDLISASDGTASHQYEYSYENPYHDNFEKIDYGYTDVKTLENGKKELRESYYTDYFILRGEKRSDLLLDSLGAPYIGHSHILSYMDAAENQITELCNDAAVFVAYDRYQTDYYEGGTTPAITTRYYLEYDKYYNVTCRRDSGDIVDPNDDWIQTIQYYQPDQNLWHNNLISLPTEDCVKHGANLLRRSSAIYNDFGRPKWVKKHDSMSSNGINTYLGYDSYGNLAEISYPEDALSGGHRPWLKIGYDNVTHTYPNSLLNPFNEQQFMKYDYRFGLPTVVVDASGYGIQYEYDKTGRLVNVLSPRDYLEAEKPYTVHYSYRIRGHELDANTPLHSQHSYIIKVGLADNSVQVESTIYDQRGHEKQKKRIATVSGNVEWVTDGVSEYDVFYNPTAKYLPFISNAAIGDWDDTPTSSDVMTMSYDVLDRITSLQNYDNTNKYWVYGFDKDCQNKQRLLTEITDENLNTSSIFKTPQEWTTQTLTPDGYGTCYEYNPIGELTKVTDADGYETTYTYDKYGNCIRRNHPDAGVTDWTYAPNGCVARIRTEQLHLLGYEIEYAYDFGRLTHIDYPVHPENNVTNYYDYAGRIQLREDGVGSEELGYDELGNINYSKRRVYIPTESHVYFFETRHKYDSFGKIQHIIYPDRDSVAYDYLLTGELASVSRGIQGHTPIVLIDNLTYDKFGHIKNQSYGNGVISTYTYDSLRQWLVAKDTRLPYSGPQIQDLHYSFDHVGNITVIRQGGYDYYGIGGDYINNYTYDNQYRLIQSTGTSNYDFNYDFSASYSPSGRLGHNSCGANIVDKKLTYGYDDQFLTHQPRVVYDTISSLPYNLYWDANGNLHAMSNCKLGVARFHDWDEENRLHAVVGPSYAGFYGYDGNGSRIWKLTGSCSNTSQNGGMNSYNVYIDDAVLYPNPYITITPQGYTKHYYLGSERIATALGEGGWDISPATQNNREGVLIHYWLDPFGENYPFGRIDIPKTVNQDITGYESSDLQYECSNPIELESLHISYAGDILASCISNYLGQPVEPSEFFYTHSDHLGSASWITDRHAEPVQYIHYAPYGELLANQTPYGYDERYKFTGKERDAESGYDYFGARFLSTQLGIWITPDPLLDKYIFASPYMYCNGNPIKYVDPDGNAVHIAVGAVVGAFIGGTIAGISAMNDPTLSRRQVMGKIAGGALSGAITGGAAAATGGLSFIGTGGTIAASAAAGLIGESAGSAVSQGIGNGEIDGGEVARAGLVGAAAGVITGAASKGVSEAVKKSGVVQNIQTKMLDGVKSGTGKAAKQQANQTRKSIINFCSPGNDKQFQMKDLITYPADVVGQEVSAGATNSESVEDKTQEVQSNVVDILGL